MRRIGTRLAGVCLLVGVALSLSGCGPDFHGWTADAQRLADEVGARVIRVERFDESDGSMYDDAPSHVEMFATIDADPEEARAMLRSAGERLGYTVVDSPYLLMNRPGSVINVRVPDEPASPLEITIASQ